MGFVELVFVLDVGVGGSVREVAASAAAGEVTTFRIFAFTPCTFQLHIL